MKEQTAHFSEILIVESLNEGKTGTKLYEDLKILALSMANKVGVKLFERKSKAELLGLLASLSSPGHEQISKPLLHIEAHGSDDQAGIITASGEFLSWEELKEPLTRINVISGLNLIVVISACFGAFSVKAITPNCRAPCWGLIGPCSTVSEGDLLKDTLSMYQVLLDKGSICQAMIAMNARCGAGKVAYVFVSSESMFIEFWVRYMQKYTDPTGFKFMTSYVREQLLYTTGVNYTSDKLKRMLEADIPKTICKYSETYFMFDLYPENKTRFKVDYEMICRGRKA